MHHILIVTLLVTLVACAKEVPPERVVEPQDVTHEVNSEKPRAGKEAPVKESSEFTYIGLTLDQAQAATGKRNDRFRVVKRDGVDLPVTFDFVYGRINAEIVDGLVVGFSVEGGG